MKHQGVVFCLILLVVGSFAACPHTDATLVKVSTLDGSLWTADAEILITDNNKYLFDLTSTPTIKKITINNGAKLVFDDTKDVSMNVQELIIDDGGELIIGSCDCPYEHNAVITLMTPTATLEGGPNTVGSKVLAVKTGGKLNLHGKVRKPTWTKLDASAPAGSTTITLKENVEWIAGDKIVLTSTDYDWEQYEEFTIASVNGNQVTLTQPLQKMHYGKIVDSVDTRGEVGVINRNILIKGDDSSAASELGGHLMFMSGSTVYLEGIEVTKAGQKGLLGRYPIHWHMAGDVTGKAYLKDSSIHDNFQRCIVVHGTHSVVIKRNLAYKTFGHCVFLEDGAETNNYFAFNLAFGAQKVNAGNAKQLIPSDSEPAVYWITNPNNTFIENVAAGGDQFGFWFAAPLHPMGLSAGLTNMFPINTPLKRFDYNSAHSHWDGLFIDRGPNPNGCVSCGDSTDVYNPIEDPNAEDEVPVHAVFNGFTGWRNRNRGSWIRGGWTTLKNCKFADNAIGCTFATNAYFGTVEDSIFVGQTDNLGNPPNWEAKGLAGNSLPQPWAENEETAAQTRDGPHFPIRGAEMYDGPISVRRCHFYKYISDEFRRASALSMLRRDKFGISATNEAEGIVLADDGSDTVLFADRDHDGDRNSIFIDLDGSVTGRPPADGKRAVVTNMNPFLRTVSCVEDANSEVNVCPDQYGALSIHIAGDYAMTPSADYFLEIKRLGYQAYPQRLCGGGLECPNSAHLDAVPDDFQSTVVLGKYYGLQYTSTAPPTQRVWLTYTNRWADAEKTKQNFVIIGMCVPPSATVTSVNWNWKGQSGGSLSPAASRDAVFEAVDNGQWSTRGNGMWYLETQSTYAILWSKIIPADERTAENMRTSSPVSGIEVQFGGFNSATAPVTCTWPVLGDNSDEGLPPIGTVTPSVLEEPIPSIARDDDQTCDTGNTEVPAPGGIPTPPVNASPVPSIGVPFTPQPGDAAGESSSTIVVMLSTLILTIVSLALLF